MVTPDVDLVELFTCTDVQKLLQRAHSVRSINRVSLLSKFVHDLIADADAAAEFECVLTAAVNSCWASREDRLDKHKQEMSKQQKRQVTDQKQQLAAQKQQLANQQQQISQLTTEVKQLSSTAKAASDASAPVQKKWRDIVTKDIKRQVSKEVVKLSKRSNVRSGNLSCISLV